MTTIESDLRRRLAELVSAASDGEVAVDEILNAPDSLAALGVTSLALIRFLDAVEAEFAVYVDLEESPALMDSIDGLAAFIAESSPPSGH
ncbi:phosphopantetheine-binding protein [Rhizohabitans arisaemae]|uniref:phosphopantetheine-binding protein n=1 Tax=Rhizohabitans arisaemae TaxID=2720610 RepID=UPI0024B06275|nr:phosphopantetheine-binding protein [Rhizohabitans arisaemae]